MRTSLASTNLGLDTTAKKTEGTERKRAKWRAHLGFSHRRKQNEDAGKLGTAAGVNLHTSAALMRNKERERKEKRCGELHYHVEVLGGVLISTEKRPAAPIVRAGGTRARRRVCKLGKRRRLG